MSSSIEVNGPIMTIRYADSNGIRAIDMFHVDRIVNVYNIVISNGDGVKIALDQSHATVILLKDNLSLAASVDNLACLIRTKWLEALKHTNMLK